MGWSQNGGGGGRSFCLGGARAFLFVVGGVVWGYPFLSWFSFVWVFVWVLFGTRLLWSQDCSGVGRAVCFGGGRGTVSGWVPVGFHTSERHAIPRPFGETRCGAFGDMRLFGCQELPLAQSRDIDSSWPKSSKQGWTCKSDQSTSIAVIALPLVALSSTSLQNSMKTFLGSFVFVCRGLFFGGDPRFFFFFIEQIAPETFGSSWRGH